MDDTGSATAHIRVEYSPDKVEGFNLSDGGISADGTQYHGEAAIESVSFLRRRNEN